MVFKDLNKLSEKILEEKKLGKKIIWTNGCFDIMHPGHMSTFKKCKELADIVIVGLNGDQSPYWSTKPGRPINDQFFRSEMLDSLKNVDYIYIFNDENPSGIIDILKPDFVLKGGDYILDDFKEEVENKNGVIDLTCFYKKMLNDGIEKYRGKKGFLPEGEINVKNGGKVVVVSIIEGCSTTNIVNKIKS